MNFLGALIVLVAIVGVVLVLFRRLLYALFLGLTPPKYSVAAEYGIRIAMRDGITLATDHYYPRDGASFPTILIRSPYGRDRAAGGFGLLLDFYVRRFVERGYHVIVQDARGRFDSGGEFDPYFSERDDGLDTLEWLKHQTWFNGKLGTWGPSYLGITQWTLATGSSSVQAMVPAITASKLQQVIFPDGALDLGLIMRWIAIFQLLDHWRTMPKWKSLLNLRSIERTVVPSFMTLPLSEADRKITGETVPYFRKWLEHAAPNDPLWQRMLEEMSLKRLQTPAHLIGGWYDFFLRGLLADYAELKLAGQNPYLTVGPWFHFSDTMVMTNSLYEGLNWFDAFLKGDRARLRQKPIHLYIMGANEWRDFDNWPPAAQNRHYYLSNGFALRFDPPDEKMSSDSYHYDPTDPTPAVGGTQFSLYGGPRSNRSLESRGDVLVYTFGPLDEPIEVIGPIHLELYVKSSLPYTDFFGRLCDVQRNGNSINVCDGLFRVEPGKGTCQEDSSLRIEIDMWATAYHFKKGHRIRLQVSSGAHPRWLRNFGTGDLLASDGTMLAADQTIYHDASHPSALVLPVVRS